MNGCLVLGSADPVMKGFYWVSETGCLTGFCHHLDVGPA